MILKKAVLFFVGIILLQGLAYAGFDKKVKLKNNVTFDHGKHLKQKDIVCKVCHPSAFKMKAGADKMTMKDINAGKFCGICHKEGGRAFIVKDNCGKCHVKPKV